MCEVMLKRCCLNERWTQEISYFSILTVLQDVFNDAAVLDKVTLSLVERIGICIQADSDHFEHLLK